MAGQVKTDLAAVAAAIGNTEIAAMPAGMDAKMAVEVLQAKRDDLLRGCKALDDQLPSGSAKTALGTVISDLA